MIESSQASCGQKQIVHQIASSASQAQRPRNDGNNVDIVIVKHSQPSEVVIAVTPQAGEAIYYLKVDRSLCS
jgi:hypothetical protein